MLNFFLIVYSYSPKFIKKKLREWFFFNSITMQYLINSFLPIISTKWWLKYQTRLNYFVMFGKKEYSDHSLKNIIFFLGAQPGHKNFLQTKLSIVTLNSGWDKSRILTYQNYANITVWYFWGISATYYLTFCLCHLTFPCKVKAIKAIAMK